MRVRDLAIPALTGLVVATFALGFVGPVTTVFSGVDARSLVLVPAAVFVLVTAVVYRKRRRPGRGGDDRSIWDAIPNWQYTGRHVEAGGITVDEQERAIRDVKAEAEAREGER